MKTKARDFLHNWILFPPVGSMLPEARILAIASSAQKALFEEDFINHGFDEDPVSLQFKRLNFSSLYSRRASISENGYL